MDTKKVKVRIIFCIEESNVLALRFEKIFEWSTFIPPQMGMDVSEILPLDFTGSYGESWSVPVIHHIAPAYFGAQNIIGDRAIGPVCLVSAKIRLNRCWLDEKDLTINNIAEVFSRKGWTLPE